MNVTLPIVAKLASSDFAQSYTIVLAGVMKQATTLLLQGNTDFSSGSWKEEE